MMALNLGFVSDLPDPRDFKERFSFLKDLRKDYPKEIDNQDYFLSPLDQGALPLCVGYSLAYIAEYLHRMWITLSPDGPDRLSPEFIWHNAKKLSGDDNYNIGISIRDGLKALKKHGACFTDDYNNILLEPSEDALKTGLEHIISEYRVISGIKAIKRSLSSHKGVIIGIKIYPSYYKSKSSGVIPLPDSELPIENHSLAVVGYDEMGIHCINSMGKEWGYEGYIFIPNDVYPKIIITSWEVVL